MKEGGAILVALASFLAICAGAKFHSVPVHLHHGKPTILHSTIVKELGLYKDGNHSFPAGGAIWPTAIYWTFIDVGTPPKSFPVCIDSGSSNLDIEGINCQGCNKNKPNSQYDPLKSSTSKRADPPTFSNSYLTCDLDNLTARCTVSGNVYEDQVSIGGVVGPVPVQFGSINKITENFDQFKALCGVMGFIGDGKRNVFSQLVDNKVVDNVFALCINNEGAESNGTLTIGGVDTTLYLGDMNYVQRKTPFYSIAVEGFSIGNSKSSLTGLPPNAILDTGTNILLLPDEAYASMKSQFLGLCKEGAKLKGICDAGDEKKTLFDGECFELSDADVSDFPSFYITLENGYQLAMNNFDYLLKGDVRAKGNKSLTCLAVRATGEGGYFIFGDTLMRNYYLVFDRDRDRIGWAKVNKDACGNEKL
jgi:cathepsin D